MKRPLLLLASLLSLASPQLAFAAPSADLVAPFSAAAMEFPESIAIDRAGNCYLSMVATNVIKKVTPAGVQSVFTTIKDNYIQGLAFDASDNLFVGGGRGVWKVTPAGVITLFAAIPGEGVNDITFAPDGSIYATVQVDEKSTQLWKVDPTGSAKMWSSSATLPSLLPKKSFMPFTVAGNGLVVDPTNKFLYVTVTSAGRLVEIKINADGSAGTARVIVESDALIGTDAVRLDAGGNFYTAVNLLNRISKITPEGKITDVASGGLLSFPTSLALDVRNGRTTLYVCNNGNFFFGETQINQGLLRVVNPDASRLLQVSTRAQIGTGSDILVAGFVIEGTAAKTVLVRAVGPTLGSFGVTNALADPRLDLYAAGQSVTQIYSNDNWGGDAQLVTAAAGSGAFALAGAASRDAALLVTLAPGTYTARVSGVGNTTGIALLEIYEVP
jgi:sugar lactone lactonase YvrE